MKTLLSIPAEDKERALTLGVLFDAKTGHFFAPEGVELAHYKHWLPSETNVNDLTIPAKGVSLTQLLTRVTGAIDQAFPRSEWVKLEIASLRSNGGHLYFDAVDRDLHGRELSKAKGIIWASAAGRLGRKFYDATGARLENGLKIMVLAKAQFTGQHGFSLLISDIDPEYTLGDMYAKLKRIREMLNADGIATKNKDLPPPVDFSHVAVVAPEGAAGLEDFEVEARLLQQSDLCRFSFFYAIFQGQHTRQSLKSAIIEAHQCHVNDKIDALVIIRGGGATTDLQWLNDDLLAKMVCRFHVPVITGIGHERDTTILDECAHRSLGTPSKVINFIREMIASRAVKAWEDWQFVCQTASRRLSTSDARVDQSFTEVGALLHKRADQATHSIEQDFVRLQHAAQNTLDLASKRAEIDYTNVVNQAGSQMAMAEKTIEHLSSTVQDQAVNIVNALESTAKNHLDTVVLAARRSIDGINEHIEEYKAGIMNSAARSVDRLDDESGRHFCDVQHFAKRMLQNAESNAEETIATVLSQGVDRTLKRGFAMVTANGLPITSKEVAEKRQDLSIRFNDGTLDVKVRESKNG